MNDTHRIVVYTPVTDALYNGGMLIPLIGGLASAAILFIVLMMFFEKGIKNYYRSNDKLMAACAILSILVGAGVLHWLAN